MSETLTWLRHHGFTPRQVCWGYRDRVIAVLERLHQAGRIGARRPRATRAVLDLLAHADRQHFDHVVHQFLTALHPGNAWLFDIPELLRAITTMGTELGRERIYRGIRFFACLADDHFGATPAAVRACLDTMRRLRATDDDLAIAFLQGCPVLRARLRDAEMSPYLDAALKIWPRDRHKAYAFLRLELPSCERYLQAITREARLDDHVDHLTRVVRALLGTTVTIDDLGGLDSDELLPLGSSTIACHDQLFLPRRVRLFATAAWNRSWYTLAACATAALIRGDGFTRIHGHSRYPHSAALVGPEPWRQNLFAACEYARTLRTMQTAWPGAGELLAPILARERVRAGAEDDLVRLVDDLLHDHLAEAAVPGWRTAVNCFATVEVLAHADNQAVAARYPLLTTRTIAPPGFLPDFRFPLRPQAPPADHTVRALQDTATRHANGSDNAAPTASTASSSNAATEDTVQEEAAATTAYLYDEWDFIDGAYLSQHCQVHEAAVPEPTETATPPPEVALRARQVARVFQRLRPAAIRPQHRCPDGDTIDTDRLVDYRIARQREPAPPVDFFARPRPRRRDLAVSVLMDVSGSTATRDRHGRVLDLEQHAALILDAGLHAAGDSYEIAGFDSHGRDRCRYVLFKSFDQAWPGTAERILAARPHGATRIGPALRHAGHRLNHTSRRQRLILLITDGLPQDSGYDPDTGYAQHDVRMACEENLRRGVHTFAIATTTVRTADMALMFPHRRFLQITDIGQLPRLLPRCFARLTAL